VRRPIGVVLAAAAASVSMPVDAQANDLRSIYRSLYEKVRELHGVRAPGRNIALYGVRTRHGERHARRAELRGSIAVLRRMLASAPRPPAPRPPAPAPASAPTTVAPTSSTPAATSPGAGLQRIARCESGGNPSAVDPTGTYRGKYQFDLQTWQSVGGSGDPAVASEAEQDMRAQRLYAQRGAAAWPVCGSR
jgi:Transglycosylase-like domain